MLQMPRVAFKQKSASRLSLIAPSMQETTEGNPLTTNHYIFELRNTIYVVISITPRSLYY